MRTRAGGKHCVTDCQVKCSGWSWGFVASFIWVPATVPQYETTMRLEPILILLLCTGNTVFLNHTWERKHIFFILAFLFLCKSFFKACIYYSIYQVLTVSLIHLQFRNIPLLFKHPNTWPLILSGSYIVSKFKFLLAGTTEFNLQLLSVL